MNPINQGVFYTMSLASLIGAGAVAVSLVTGSVRPDSIGLAWVVLSTMTATCLGSLVLVSLMTRKA